MILWRAADNLWRWRIHNGRCEAGPWVRIESAVASLEEVLGVQTEWSYRNQRVRTLTVTGRPVDVEIRRRGDA